MNGRPWPTATHVRHWLASSLFLLTSRRTPRTWTHVWGDSRNVAVASTRTVDISIVVGRAGRPADDREKPAHRREQTGTRLTASCVWLVVTCCLPPPGAGLVPRCLGNACRRQTVHAEPRERSFRSVGSEPRGIRGCPGFLMFAFFPLASYVCSATVYRDGDSSRRQDEIRRDFSKVSSSTEFWFWWRWRSGF